MNQWQTPIRLVARSVMAVAAAAAGLMGSANAAVPGITGPTFNLSASADLTSQPDGAMIYTWGFGCTSTPAGFAPAVVGGSQGPAAYCPKMQLPGPTLIVHEGDLVTVNLTNSLPGVAGKTSMVFPGQNVAANGGAPGSLAQEAGAGDCATTNCNKVSYSFTASKPGTYAYHSGSRPEVQVEMGMYGALIVLPATPGAACHQGAYSLSKSAYDHAATCYDREYLFQFSEFSSVIHDQVKAQVDNCSASTCPLNVTTDPYRPNYYMVNGRSMPDLMDTSYSPAYARQPYNGNPHMHPGETVLMRNIGHGRWQHPFHFHGNHARVIARDGNMLVSATDPSKLAGPLLFTLPTLPGQTVDMLYGWTGEGLNWDIYGDQGDHSCNGVTETVAAVWQANPAAHSAQLAALKLNGGFDPVTKEYCPDHGKPMPVTPPDASIVANGQWYGGTPYLGLSNFDPTKLAPGTLNQNPSAGYAYMWHSHNEREITTNDVFPGGILMMLIIDPTSWVIDETL
jgi:FtsP/CotA-like multicopper oxidase with cupredoxin domain